MLICQYCLINIELIYPKVMIGCKIIINLEYVIQITEFLKVYCIAKMKYNI